MSKPEVFQAFWHGRPLPVLQWACLQSFVRRGHRVHLYTYDEIEVPPGVEVMPAAEVVPRSQIFYFDNLDNNIPRDISPFSDFFRFRLLLERGGWYVDTDVLCLAATFPACAFAWAQELPEMAPHKIGTSQIKFPAGDPIARRLYEECDRLRPTFTIREQLGPFLISEILAEYPVPDSHFGNPDAFYPLRWIETYKLWLPSYRAEIARKANDALFINCYNSLFSYMKLSNSGLPPRGSFLMDMYEEYCPERINGEFLTEETVIALARKFLCSNDWALGELRAVAGEESVARLNVRLGA
jgi:mannosyltransferase OCH1-like enzyme